MPSAGGALGGGFGEKRCCPSTQTSSSGSSPSTTQALLSRPLSGSCRGQPPAQHGDTAALPGGSKHSPSLPSLPSTQLHHRLPHVRLSVRHPEGCTSTSHHLSPCIQVLLRQEGSWEERHRVFQVSGASALTINKSSRLRSPSVHYTPSV